MRLIALILLGAAMLAAQTFDVIHKKPLWPDGHGRVEISEEAIAFEAQEEENSRRWTYTDIQHFDRISTKEFILLSYEDEKWKLGRDRSFHFVLTSGELTDDVMQAIARRLGKPLTERVVGEVAAPRYQLPVKHLHSFGGCEGKLLFTDDAIFYSTGNAKDARAWRFGLDVQSISSTDPYQMEFRVFENNRREFSRSRVYKFALKQPLDPPFYRDLKRKLYDIEKRVVLGDAEQRGRD
jgi:hypothetical protein